MFYTAFVQILRGIFWEDGSVRTEPKYPDFIMIHHDPEPLLSVIKANVYENGSELEWTDNESEYLSILIL